METRLWSTDKVVILSLEGHGFELRKQSLIENVRKDCIYQIVKRSGLSQNTAQI